MIINIKLEICWFERIFYDSQERVYSKFNCERDGPYRIRDSKSSVSCGLETIDKTFVGTYHISHLTPYKGDPKLKALNPIYSWGCPHKSSISHSNIPVEQPFYSDENYFQGFEESDLTDTQTVKNALDSLRENSCFKTTLYTLIVRMMKYMYLSTLMIDF